MGKALTVDEGLQVALGLGLKTYEHNFGSSSNANIEGVLPRVVDVARLGIKLCAFDGTVIPDGGVRSQASANQNAENGTGIANSRHLVQADGFGHAIDCIALTPGKGIDWNNAEAFRAMANAIKVAAAILNFPIRQGCDWNMNGTFAESNEWDWAHFEDPLDKYKPTAEAELARYRRVLGIDELEGQLAVSECPKCGHPLKIVSA